MPIRKDALTRLLNLTLSLILGIGGLFSLVIVVIFFYAFLFSHSIPHAYELPLSVLIPEQVLSAASTRGGTEYLTLARWKVNLLAVERDSPGFFALQLGWIVFQPGITLWIVWLVRKIVVSVQAGTPFNKEAFRRLKTIGWAIILAAAGRTGEDYLAGVFARSHYSLSAGSIGLSFDYMSLFWGGAVGLLILVLAEVFQYGYGIQQDTELTV